MPKSDPSTFLGLASQVFQHRNEVFSFWSLQEEMRIMEWRHRFPYLVSIHGSYENHFCTGALVTEIFALTTATCAMSLGTALHATINGVGVCSQSEEVSIWRWDIYQICPLALLDIIIQCKQIAPSLFIWLDDHLKLIDVECLRLFGNGLEVFSCCVSFWIDLFACGTVW